MARTAKLRCDICQEEISEVKCKIFLVPFNGPGRKRHTDYTAHADIGACCLPRLSEQISFTRRVKGGRQKNVS